MSEDSFPRTDDEVAFVIDDTIQDVSGGSDTAPITVQVQRLIEDLNELARKDAPQDKLPDMILHQLCTLFSWGFESGNSKRLPAEVRLEVMGALGMCLRNCIRVGWEFSQHKWFTVVRDLSFSELETLLRPIQSSTVLRELEFHDRVGVSDFTSEIYTSEFWTLIAGIIHSAENLESFRASSVGMSATDLSLIAQAFTCGCVSNLIHLDLSCNPIRNDREFFHIVEVLGGARYLKRLVLSGTGMDMDGAQLLGQRVTYMLLHHKSDDLILDLDTESILIQARDTQVESDADSVGEEDCDDNDEEEGRRKLEVIELCEEIEYQLIIERVTLPKISSRPQETLDKQDMYVPLAGYSTWYARLRSTSLEDAGYSTLYARPGSWKRRLLALAGYSTWYARLGSWKRRLLSQAGYSTLYARLGSWKRRLLAQAGYSTWYARLGSWKRRLLPQAGYSTWYARLGSWKRRLLPQAGYSTWYARLGSWKRRLLPQAGYSTWYARLGSWKRRLLQQAGYSRRYAPRRHPRAGYSSLKPIENRAIENDFDPGSFDCSLQCGARLEEHLHLVQLQLVLRELEGTSPKCGRVFLCGAHQAGKSQLARSFVGLGAPWYKWIKEKVSRQTLANDIQVLRNDESLQISIWDLPGHDTFSVLQEVLFPKRNKPCYFLFVFSVYDHEIQKMKNNLAQSFENECLLWLSFIASNSYQTEFMLLEVIVVMTYKDKIVDGTDSRWALPILEKLQRLFRGVLNISSNHFFVNGCEKIDAKAILDHLYERFQNHLRSDRSLVPKVCCQMCTYMLNWTSKHQESPVMTYQRFLYLCKKADSTLEKFLNKHPQDQQLSVARAIASYLHDVGIVIQLVNQEILVVNPNWFMQAFLGRLIGMGRGYQKACEGNVKRPISQDGFLLKSEFQALVTEHILQPLTRDTDKGLDFSVLQTLMESLDLCYEMFDGVRESRFFVPTLVEVEERSPLRWGELVLGAVSYLGVRIHREDKRIACFSIHTFSKFQMMLLRRMKQNLSETYVLVNDFKFNLISILCDGHDVLVENEEEGRFIDVLVKSENTKESIWMFVEKHILGELEKFCASAEGPPGLKLVVDVLRTDCVELLTPIAKRENQSVSRELLKRKLKKSIRNQGALHVSLRDLYVHQWKEVADTNLQQKAEHAFDILPLKDVEEIGEWIKSESQGKLSWMNSWARGIPDIDGMYANLRRRIASLQLTPRKQRRSTEMQRSWKDYNEKLQSTVQEVGRPVRDDAENWEEEMTSNILKFKTIHTMWQEWCIDLFQQVDYIIGVLELNPQSPRRPYFSSMVGQNYTNGQIRIIASASVGEPMIINFACENRKKNHIVRGQHGLKINVEKENIEWIQEIVANSAIAIDCLVGAGLLGAERGFWIHVVPSTCSRKILLGKKVEANSSTSEKAYQALLQHLRYALRNQFPEYFGLYPAKYVDSDSCTKLFWLCKECRDKGLAKRNISID